MCIKRQVLQIGQFEASLFRALLVCSWYLDFLFASVKALIDSYFINSNFSPLNKYSKIPSFLETSLSSYKLKSLYSNTEGF